ncbi:hypothetical protein [Bosea thiooxidans]
MTDGRQELRQAFRRFEREVPPWFGRTLRRLRHPRARWIRLPIGVLLVVGGVFSILPVLGIWMLPIGLLLLAGDIPVLRRPVARLTVWGSERWARLRRRFGRPRS